MGEMAENDEFYLRYYVGHKGKFGHEFLEFEFRPDGKLRYANNSNYKNDTMIRKEVFLTPSVLKECRRIVADSEIMKEDDNNWPEPDRVGRQELEIVMGNEHISFTTSKIGSLMDVQTSNDPEGLRIFYYLVQDGKKVGYGIRIQRGEGGFFWSLDLRRTMVEGARCGEASGKVEAVWSYHEGLQMVHGYNGVEVGLTVLSVVLVTGPALPPVPGTSHQHMNEATLLTKT
ncbi:hypothetical protein KY290_019732 [Solanum tuberosum]|uniref:Uncharacterized protein n=2 Tax=Solanum tuberosum TaxID=4113 RepID=A0ABQ7VJ63_SOLTU|nr:hypothetical protein KY290_019732 [Solanum tuberosum]